MSRLGTGAINGQLGHPRRSLPPTFVRSVPLSKDLFAFDTYLSQGSRLSSVTRVLLVRDLLREGWGVVTESVWDSLSPVPLPPPPVDLSPRTVQPSPTPRSPGPFSDPPSVLRL